MSENRYKTSTENPLKRNEMKLKEVINFPNVIAP